MHLASPKNTGAFRSASMTATGLLRWEDKLGSIEPGKWADTVAVPGDPYANINVLQKADFVMKGGVVFKKP